MAITQVNFIAGAINAANQAEVYSFLNTYATDYFDSITNDTTSLKIECKLSGVSVITLNFDGTTKNTYSFLNGTTSTEYGVSYFTKAFATSNGVYLVGSQAKGSKLMITKNESGDTILRVLRSSTAAGACLVEVYDFNNSYASLGLTSSSTSGLTSMSKAAGVTCFAPIPTSLSAAHYCPHLFLTPYTQFLATDGIITVDGTEYVYDGAFALEE